MFDASGKSFPAFQPPGASNLNALLTGRALELFNWMHARGQAGRFWGQLTRRKWRLYDLNPLRERVRSAHSLGRRTVELRQICGSEGRTNDFDGRFRPLRENMRHRWMSVAVARLQSIPLPPVELIQAGDLYFVRDGHHRISVALALGEQVIDAEVTLWQVELPPEWKAAPERRGWREMLRAAREMVSARKVFRRQAARR